MALKGKKQSEAHIQKRMLARKLSGKNPFSNPNLNKGRKRPQNVLEIMKKTMFKKGQKAWNKGIGTKCTEAQLIRNSPEYKLWRTAVFERDSYTCIWCGIKGQKGLGRRVVLNADHIKPFSMFPELRFAIDNGRTLCVPCHRTTGTFGMNARFYSIKSFAK